MLVAGRRSRHLARMLIAVVAAASLTSCGIDQLINDEYEDDGEIYYDPFCADDDGDGWCD